jgi:hypothetical protein
LEHLQRSLRTVGDKIAEAGTPKELGPITIAVVGRGRVGSGARAMLDQLGVVDWVPPDDLKTIATDKSIPSFLPPLPLFLYPLLMKRINRPEFKESIRFSAFFSGLCASYARRCF